MSVGRKNKPAAQKIIQGTFRMDRDNKDAPIVSLDLPRAPAWLNKRACEIFGTLTARISNMGYATASHTEMLSILAMRLSEIEECSEIIEFEGLTYESKTTKGEYKVVSRPEVAMRSEAARHAQSLLAEFGLSAASMNKIVVPPKPKESRWEELPTGTR